MFKVIGDDIVYNNVKVATFNRLVPSFRDEVESALNNNFYSSLELFRMKESIKTEAIDQYKHEHE